MKEFLKLIKNIFLVIKYPFIAFIDHDIFFNRNYSQRKTVILQMLRGNLPWTTWYDCIDKGWRNSFGKQLLKELSEAAKYDGYEQQLYIYDIKEKYGELRIELFPSGHYINKVLEKYEYISYRTCGFCGKPADKTSEGWIYPYCNECADKTMVIGFSDYDDWYGYKKFNKESE